MATAQLSASPRDAAGKGAARSLRSAGKIPAVISGELKGDKFIATSLAEAK